MATVAYVRVSSENQNTERQTFEGYTVTKTFEEKASKIKIRVTMAKLSKDYSISRHTVYKIRDGEYALN